jgi:hypothetical protein
LEDFHSVGIASNGYGHAIVKPQLGRTAGAGRACKVIPDGREYEDREARRYGVSDQRRNLLLGPVEAMLIRECLQARALS